MRKINVFFILMVLTPLFSLKVDQRLLESVKDSSVEFDNYIGPYLFYNTVDEIRDIGAYLAAGITPTIKGESDYSGKYKLYHRPRLEWEKEKTSCDVFEITDKALIDNIANIELIVSQYLMVNYGYSLEDSNLLAHLLVIYNAVYRSDGVHFDGVYTSDSLITKDISKIGIDTHYINWPGNTFLYIPLSNDIILGQLTNLDTDLLIDDKVIDSIKIKEVDDIELREDIIEFKEREINEVQEKIQQQKEELVELVIESEKSENPSQKIENEIRDKKLLIEEKEAELLKKDDKILDLRDDLAEDKNSIITDEKKSHKQGGFKYILNRVDGDSYFGRIVNLSNDGEIIDKSQVNSIRNNTFNVKGDSLFIIAGGDRSNQLITLGKLDSDNLDLVTWGMVPCYENSPIIIQGKFIYAIIKSENDYYIGEFDNDLNLIRRSSVSLFRDSFIILKSTLFYIQGKDNNIKLVNLSDFISVAK